MPDTDLQDAETLHTGTDPGVDGRTARRVRNQDAVLDAVLELFAEDTLEPGAAEVAERSGVSLRSVYRYYEDREALIRAAIARNLEKLQPLFVIEPLGQGPLADRIEVMVTNRLRLYEQVAPMVRATLRAAPSNHIISQQYAHVVARMRAQVEDMFAPELTAMTPEDAREVGALADMALQFHSLEHLRRTRGFSRAEAARITTRALESALTPAAR